jgi:hypothetical protein
MVRDRGGFAEVAPLRFFVIARLVRAIQFPSSAGKNWITRTSRVMTTTEKSGFRKDLAFAGRDIGKERVRQLPTTSSGTNAWSAPSPISRARMRKNSSRSAPQTNSIRQRLLTPSPTPIARSPICARARLQAPRCWLRDPTRNGARRLLASLPGPSVGILERREAAFRHSLGEDGAVGIGVKRKGK